LTGTFPNLEIRAGAVGTNEIADGAVGANDISNGAVGTSEIADGAVTSGKIASDAVGSAQLAAINVRSGTQLTNIATAAAASGAATCSAGEQALSAGGTWDTFDATSDGQELAFINSTTGTIGQALVVGVGNQSGATRAFTPQVLCLAP
jgi:hypothetical protein